MGGFVDKVDWIGRVTREEIERVQPGASKLDEGTWGLNPGLPARAVHLDRPALSAIWLGERAMASLASRETFSRYLCRKLLPPLSRIAPDRVRNIGYLQNCPQLAGANSEEDSGVKELINRLSNTVFQQ
jgi:hypothetical protein